MRWPQRRRHAAADAARRATPTCCPRATASGWKNSSAARRGGWSARAPHGTLCHKPCTVSGGGKSEISKSIASVVAQGPGVRAAITTATWSRWRRSCKKDFSDDLQATARRTSARERPILSPERSLGSVIKLLTPSPEYTDEHNEWLRQLPQTIRQLVIHREALLPAGVGRQLARAFHRGPHQRLPGPRAEVRQPEAGRATICAWATIRTASWRIYKLRPDFHPADKVQVEDDITASVVLPRESLNDLDPGIRQPQRQAGGELRDAAVPAAGRRDPSRLRQAGGGGHRQRPARFSRISSR